MNMYILEAQNDSRNSFYGKAHVLIDGDTTQLQSYNTIVATIKGNKAIVHNTHSPTTLRHIKEFLKQHNFKADTKTQIEADYMGCN